MAVQFTFGDADYRLMFKYGWFYTNSALKTTVGRMWCREQMFGNIWANNNKRESGDLEFFDNGCDNETSKHTWRMCSVFIVKLVDTPDGHSKNEIVFGPFTSVCVPGDQFSYEFARYYAIATLKDAALDMYTKAKRMGEDCPLFHIAIQAFITWNTRKKKK